MVSSLKREYPEQPIVGVGAVVFKDKDTLLVKRGQPPAMGMWAIPGGVLNLGENTRDGVAREVLEECMITIEVGDIIDVIDAVIRDDNGAIQYHYVLCDFLAEYRAGHVQPASDVLDAKWFKYSEGLALNTTRGTQKVVKKAFEKTGRLKWMKLIEISSKSALSKSGLGYDYALNPYRGCEFGCIYLQEEKRGGSCL